MSNSRYHHGELKEALILASQKILAEKGADALSLRAIAAEVGVSHMAPYSHFKNKKALFQSVAASGFDALADKMLWDSQALSKPRELILAYGVTYVEFAIEHPQLYRLMLGQVETAGRRHQNAKSDTATAPEERQSDLHISLASPDVSSELEASSSRPFDLLRDAFAKANKAEADIKVTAQALGAWSMVHGMAALIIEGHFTLPDELPLKEFLAMAAIQ